MQFHLKISSNRDKAFVSGRIEGAVPIIFAILINCSRGASCKMVIQYCLYYYTSFTFFKVLFESCASWLKLSRQPEQYRSLEDFDVEFSEEIKSAMTEILITEDALKHGKTYGDVSPNKTLLW